jgi:predicted NAD/FAD-binding protein
MNRLQDLRTSQDYVVTLGGEGTVDPHQVLHRMDYAHPEYTKESVAAQRRLPELNTTVTAFAGAYHGWGFHEDGARSGAAAARALGGSW